jgi:triosephosphate isomerase
MRGSAITLAREIVKGAANIEDVEIALCPPAVYLDAVHRELAGTRIALGAQNAYHESAGAYTGELSPAMLLDVGCKYVILGHSERRHILGETDDDVRRKTLAVLATESDGQHLTPIVCVGELLSEREAGKTREVIRRQFEGALAELSAEQATRVVLAYEPVWAIGTGKVATSEQAEEVHQDLRNLLAERYNAGVAAAVRILYGGSVKPDNAGQLLRAPNIDGALVGGASLKAADFLGIVAAAR